MNMEDMKECPECGGSWVGEEIPAEYRGWYSPDRTHYSLLVGVYDLYQDRTVEWMCPHCKHRFPR